MKFKTNAQHAVDAAGLAVQAAEDALTQAKELIASLNGGQLPEASNSSKGSKGSAGRQPSPVQQKLRQDIGKKLQKGQVLFFTVAELTDIMGADRIQTRNAVNYLETLGAVVRYAEKLPEGRGQREMVYRVGNLETLKAVA